MRKYFERWVGDAINNASKLAELMVTDQIMSHTSPELQVWLRDREPKDVQEVCNLADLYRNARKSSNMKRDGSKPGQRPVNTSHKHSDNTDSSAHSDLMKTDQSKSPSNAKYLKFVTCYQCQKKGHYQSDCPETKKKVVGFCHSPTRLQSSFAKYKQPGKLNGIPVQMVIDTGSSCTLVHRKFIPPCSVLDRTMEIKMVDGSSKHYPIAVVDLSGPVKSIKQEVCVVDTLLVDVLLGHDSQCIVNESEHNTKDLNIGEVPAESPKDCVLEGQTFVVTRSQAIKENQSKTCEEIKVSAEQAKIDPFEPVLTNSDGLHDNDSLNVTSTNTCPDDSIPECTNDNGNSVISPIISSAPVVNGDSVVTSKSISNTSISDTNEGKPDSDSNVSDTDPQTDSFISCLTLSKDQLMALQQSDPSLNIIRSKLLSYPPKSGSGYFVHQGLYHRRIYSNDNPDLYTDQLIVPRACRDEIMSLAHSIPLAGHLGIDKTRNRILAHYFWPNIYSNVSTFCSTCPDCQKSSRKLTSDRGKLVPIPVVGPPFHKIGIDIVGPLPRTQSGNRFILTIVDYTTRYPEAFPIPSQTAEVVADSLLQFFSRMGVPEEIVSDQGTNFLSELVTQLCSNLGISKLKTSPYHAMANGLVERFNGTMKSMLRKFVHDEPKSWDKVLPFVLFAYREVPEAATGFSPFELVYGWQVRGPLSIVKESWLESDANENLIEYVLKVRTKMAKMVELAHEHLSDSQVKMKTWYDQNARNHNYNVGEEVLVLLPTSSKSLQAEWRGPFKITKKISDVDYEIDTGRVRKKLTVYHVNMLKKWKSRQEVTMFAFSESENDSDLILYPTNPCESWQNVVISDTLSSDQKSQLTNLLQSYSDIFTDKPSVTNAAVHHIETGDAKPVRLHPYRVPQAIRSQFDREIEEMLAQGIIEPSDSEWAAPVVIVPKKQNGEQTGIRICIDYRKLNSVTKFDAFPLPRMEDLIEDVCEAKYISKLDLTKGYWQIPLDEESKDKSSFITPSALYRFRVMSFGLMTAPATFQRMMQKVLAGLNFAKAYLDDVLIISKTFDEHVSNLSQVFERLRLAELRAKPSKCCIGHAEVEYLGHFIGSGKLRPLRSKIEIIENCIRPETKKQLRSFLGLLGYYRKFIPNFSEIAAPLTDRTGKKFPNQIKWDMECEYSFQTLKQALITYPVLYLPNYNSEFILQIDASERGVGAVLCQRGDNGEEHPVAFSSKKLLPREQNLATVEKECLALVWAVELFRPYIYGRKFIVETDHNSLVWLDHVKTTNRKLLRWSLILQQYNMEICHKAGKHNLNADALSRL